MKLPTAFPLYISSPTHPAWSGLFLYQGANPTDVYVAPYDAGAHGFNLFNIRLLLWAECTAYTSLDAFLSAKGE